MRRTMCGVSTRLKGPDGSGFSDRICEGRARFYLAKSQDFVGHDRCCPFRSLTKLEVGSDGRTIGAAIGAIIVFLFFVLESSI